jgi:chromosome partitioning protein
VTAPAKTAAPPVRTAAPWVISLTGQKGGVGKTTLALLLASTTADISGRALVVDVDSQGSATEIAAAAGDSLPFDFAATTDLAELAQLRAARDYDSVFVDLPGSLDGLGILGQVMRSTDLAIIPMIPERQAVTPTLRTAQAIAAAGVEYRVVMNLVDPLRGTGPLEAAWELLDREGIPRMRTFVRRYVSIAQSQLDGLPLTKYRGDRSWRPALDDARRLQTELLLILGRMAQEGRKS